jgi:hypothetical protein
MSGGVEAEDVVGFGRAAPPPYRSGPGESIEGQHVNGDFYGGDYKGDGKY